ncbi:MAG: hypothetical protein ABI192_14360 [Bradyrhizobium sp.]
MTPGQITLIQVMENQGRADVANLHQTNGVKRPARRRQCWQLIAGPLQVAAARVRQRSRLRFWI